VPVDQLLPTAHQDGGDDPSTGSVWSPGQKVVIDLVGLEGVSGPEVDLIRRYLGIIQVKRQDFNGRVLTIRGDDLQALAAILGTGVDDAPARLAEMGLLRLPATS